MIHTPANTVVPGGFCSKSMCELSAPMEGVRAGSDLQNLVVGADRYSCEFTCSDGVVRFRLEAERNG